MRRPLPLLLLPPPPRAPHPLAHHPPPRRSPGTNPTTLQPTRSPTHPMARASRPPFVPIHAPAVLPRVSTFHHPPEASTRTASYRALPKPFRRDSRPLCRWLAQSSCLRRCLEWLARVFNRQRGLCRSRHDLQGLGTATGSRNTARAPTRHPLFGLGGTSLFPNVGTSLGTNPATSPPIGGSSPVLSSQPLNLADAGDDGEPTGRPPAALPSYLKIPTAIPSSHVSPNSPPASIYSQHSDHMHSSSDRHRQRSQSPSLQVPVDDILPSHVVGGAATAAAVLNTEDVVIPPGIASKASSPIEGRGAFFGQRNEIASKEEHVSSEISVEEARAAGIDVTDLPTSPLQRDDESAVADADAESGSAAAGDDNERQPRALERSADTSHTSADGTSRTPTPKPHGHGPRTLTPTGNRTAGGLRSLSPASGPSTSIGPPSQPISTKRSHVDVQTGSESGYNTPLLPPGLTSAPPSASVPGVTPLTQTTAASPSQKRENVVATDGPRTPTVAGFTSTSSQPSTPISAKTQGGHTNDQHAHASHASATQHQTPLMPIVLTWRAGGREVFVTGTFANEWRSKILLHKSKRDHTCVLHLPPGTHRLKFIVDDRWRVSRDLPTATDGDGNLVNYVEIPNVGPAHPGPLSAPGEDLPEPRRATEANATPRSIPRRRR